MPVQFLVHLLFLLITVLTSFIWSTSPTLAPYTLQFIGILVILYFVFRLSISQTTFVFFIDGIIFCLVTLLLVNQTGGLQSPVFFLIYVLLFGISLLFDPLNVIVFSLILCLFLFPKVQVPQEFMQIFGLLLVTPIALYFGKQYLKVLEVSQKIKILKKERVDLASEVKQQEKDTKTWLSLSFRSKVVSIIDHSSNLIADLGRLNLRQKKELEQIHADAKELLELGEKLKEKVIDEE